MKNKKCSENGTIKKVKNRFNVKTWVKSVQEL